MGNHDKSKNLFLLYTKLLVRVSVDKKHGAKENYNLINSTYKSNKKMLYRTGTVGYWHILQEICKQNDRRSKR